MVTLNPISLGPFELHAPIGVGGMSEVWRGRHVQQDVPVAVKILTTAWARNEVFLDVFRNETRAVARLNHPGIVMLFDYGEIPGSVERRSAGRLRAGSPYLVMDLASTGPLTGTAAPRSWSELVRVLMRIMSALAHAHARGVIHRDLKPGNILVSAPGDLRPGIKITDFGIARAIEPTEEQRPDIAGGTPLYMAPEQFLGLQRDVGPWTDLYSLGCIAFELCAGHPPFQAAMATALALQHLRDKPPLLVPTFAIPRAFEAWVLRLLEKDRFDRFQRAADAAFALSNLFDDSAATGEEATDQNVEVYQGDDQPTNVDLALGEPPSGAFAFPGGMPGTLPFIDAARLAKDVTPSATQSDVGVTEPSRPIEISAPPLPTTWRRSEPNPPSPKLLGAGLSLYGIRRVPLVDRDPERGRIWNTLLRVDRDRRPELVVLRGPSGSGKTRVAQWMCERADEVGGAIVLTAHNARGQPPREGLRRMMARHLGCLGLEREEVLSRCEALFDRMGVQDEYEWNAMTEFLIRAPADYSQDSAGFVRFFSADERFALLQRQFRRLAQERSVIVRMDDVQWGADCLLLTRFLLDSDVPGRILILMTARDDELAERPLEEEILAELIERSTGQEIPVGALHDGDQLELVQELLGLEPSLARRVVDRTAGNPLFATRLVGDWVDRGLLELGPTGFALRSDSKTQLPLAIEDVWNERLDLLLEAQPAEAIVALEIAAVLGNVVELREWDDVCARSGITVPPGLVSAMFAARLAYGIEDGSAPNQNWRFAHSMLRESLESHARKRRRLKAHHRLCAEMLSTDYDDSRGDPADRQERIGWHFAAAEEALRALTPLLEAAKARWLTGEVDRAKRLIDAYERALTGLAVENRDLRWPQCWCLRARLLSLQGKHDQARTWAERAHQHADYFDLGPARVEGLRTLAEITHNAGNQIEAHSLVGRALQLLDVEGDQEEIGRCLLAAADIYYRMGRFDDAAACYRRAEVCFEKLDVADGLAHASWGLGYVAMWRGDYLAATAHFDVQKAISVRAGNRHATARAYNALGDVERLRNAPDRARKLYETAESIFLSVGAAEATVCSFNVAFTDIVEGNIEAAERTLQRIGPALLTSRGAVAAPWLALCRVVISAVRGDWDAFDRQFLVACEHLDEFPQVEGDMAWLAELAGRTARHEGQPERARRAFELAIEQWRAVGREDHAAALAADP